ncbi:MAG: hypothetical protein PHR16_16710 [Methylovulum sp.]|nr:hypothetical protein [Methylovulum sp.]
MTADEQAKLLRETREIVAAMSAKMDAWTTRFDENRDRLSRVEDLCEVKRAKIADLSPLLPAVFGAPGQQRGLLERMHELEQSAVTKDSLARNVGLVAAIWGLAASVFGTAATLLAHGAMSGGIPH